MHFNGASLAVEHQDWAHKKTGTIVGGDGAGEPRGVSMNMTFINTSLRLQY